MQTTQLFFSFYLPDLHYNISHLQTALQEISTWMTANLLTLNSSKTEFFFVGLKQQLAKIKNCPLSTTHFARNLGFIFDEHLSFSDAFHSIYGRISSAAILEIFNAKEWPDLEIWVWGPSRSWKKARFDHL